MKLRFLCGTHKMELVKKPGLAIHVWQSGFDSGQLLYEQGEWRDALPHLGCAFEASEILMTARVIEMDSVFELFASSSALLIKNLLKLEQPLLAREVQERAICRLQKELVGDRKDQHLVKKHLKVLLTCMRDTEDLYAQDQPGKPSVPHGKFATVH